MKRRLNTDEDKKRFNTMLVESILESLDFGEIVLRFLELNFNLDRNRIAEQPELFAKYLEETLGSWMAVIFERNILKNLCRKLDVSYVEVEKLSFPEAAKKLLKNIQKQQNLPFNQ